MIEDKDKAHEIMLSARLRALKRHAEYQEAIAEAYEELTTRYAEIKAHVLERNEAERIARDKQERYRLDMLRYKPRGW